MTVETHEIVFSFDQPGDTRNPLLSILQQLLNRPLTRDSRAAVLLGAQRVLIVDSQQERAQYIAHLLSSAGFWPFVAPTPLDAYTLFLQGTFHPFAIILSEEGVANQFFLNRLSQQFLQRYDWKVPFISLRILPSSQIAPRSTEPLTYGQQASPRSMSPLSLPGLPEQPRTPSSPLQQPRMPSSPLQQPRTPSSPLQQPGMPSPPLQQPRMPASWPGEQPMRMPSQQPSIPAQQPSAPLRQGTPLPSQEGEPSIRMRLSSAPFNAPTLTPPSQPPKTPLPERPAGRGSASPASGRPHAPLPSSYLKPDKKQVEKISLDGLSIGRYQLKSVLGGNPIGDVYLTYDRLREQDIALKTIQTNMIPFHLMEGLEEDYNLFQQEQDLLQKVEHPHITRVTNIGKSYISGYPFIYKTMPYYAEGSLVYWLNRLAGNLPAPSDAARIILQLADAIQLLHNRGMLYQNFKMTNILVVNETKNMRELHVVLSDLPFVQDVINLPKTVESYRYFAPEQWEGESFTSSDQYGLAVLAYELLTGRPPFQGNSDGIMRRMHLTMPAPAPSSFNPQIYPFIDKVILRALSKRPEERFESVTAFATALERASN